jgi:2-oxoisovalerate dehydrogenase E1 component
MGRSILRRPGSDAVIVTWGTTVNVALEAAAQLADEGADVAVLDLRWLNPLDQDGLCAAVTEAAGKVIVLHEANQTGGFGAEILARLHELLNGKIDLEVTRVATPDMRIPAAPTLQRALLPSAAKVIDAVSRLLAQSKK